jgi:hypothetical protein
MRERYLPAEFLPIGGWFGHNHYVSIDHHTIAAVSIAGTFFAVLGSLYLAYDLLGGRHGPLRLLTRAVTYSVVFGVGYGIDLGLFFGLAAGIATGITVSVELNRASRGLEHYSLFWEGLFSAIRGLAFCAGLYRILGFEYAIASGTVITIGQIFAYSRGMRPSLDYGASRRPRILLVASFGERSSGPWATLPRHWLVALLSIVLTTPGLLRSG